MKAGIPIALSIVLCYLPQLLAAQSSPRFENYEVKLYGGRIHRPNWIRRGADGEWRDELDKLVEAPTINFAGKYFVAVHGCGTYCRYYTMTDLSTGREIDLLKVFGTGETTREGYAYLADLITRPNSRMLVVQYRFEQPRSEECRERAFVFNGTKLTPITGTRRSCTQYG
jgi:hypothetical protein